MNEHNTQIPKHMNEIFRHLQDDLLVLYTKLKSFKTLYCTSDENIKLLDNSAMGFFVMHGDLLRDDIMLSICVLTDPASTRVRGKTRDNLTIEQLLSLVPEEDSSLADELRHIIDDAKSSWDAFRGHRNQRISHSDLDTILRKTDRLLPTISIEHVDDALEFISAVLNAVELYYDNDRTTYRDGIYREGNTDELIDFLKRKEDLEKYFNHKEFGDTLE